MDTEDRDKAICELQGTAIAAMSMTQILLILLVEEGLVPAGKVIDKTDAVLLMIEEQSQSNCGIEQARILLEQSFSHLRTLPSMAREIQARGT